MSAPRIAGLSVELYESSVHLRLPFRFGAVTVREAPQAFVRIRLKLADGREAFGQTAELMVPKWFDKNPALSNDDNFDQLRLSLSLAANAYGQQAKGATAFGLVVATYDALIAEGARAGLNSLTTSFGAAQMDKAVLDALCRIEGVSVFDALRSNLPGIDATLTPDLADADIASSLGEARAQPTVHVRHTVGMIDALTAADRPASERIDDGLPETLEEVIAAYGHHYFKLKVGGSVEDDVERLTATARVLDARAGDYSVSIDGNEQYDSGDGVAELLRAIRQEPNLASLARRILFVEQPIRRSAALSTDISALSALCTVTIDESDGDLGAFPAARALGYAGVSSKACKGLYKSFLNKARARKWSSEGPTTYFMSGEDLTCQAGLAVQQDLALVAALGLKHVERNGHHYVRGMAGASPQQQRSFLTKHSDLYRDIGNSISLRIEAGQVAIGSLAGVGFASAAEPDWPTMCEMACGSAGTQKTARAS